MLLDLRDKLERIVKCFYGGSLQFEVEDSVLKELTWENQEKIIKATIGSILCKQYPVNEKFCRQFLKKIIESLEKNNLEVHDDFYSNLCLVMNTEDKGTFCYRHYLIGDDLNNIITIKETKNIVVNGTTGMRTWEAAMMLADWALCNKSVFNNKKVLEIGSGIGFTGITISKLCCPRRTILTDCHHDVLCTLKENVKINFPDVDVVDNNENGNVIELNNGIKSISVMKLDWNHIEDLKEDITPDVLIGADIVYDPEILEPLCKVIKSIFSKNKELQVFIACVIRNEDTFNLFLNKLDTFGFKYEKQDLAKCVFVEWNTNIDKSLISISLK